MSTKFDNEPSKSQLKREMHELQALGEKLAGYSAKQLAQLELPEDLLRAINEAKKITSHLAKRRQYQYIGRLMRRMEDVEPIKQAVNQIEHTTPQVIALNQQAETWRERLLTEGKEALTAFVTEIGEVDVQHLRHLIQAAKKEQETDLDKKARKNLLRFIRDFLN